MVLKNRKQNRLKNFDYSSSGYYFVTICVNKRKSTFGQIKNQKMILNKYGQMAKQCWLDIPKHFLNIELDEFIIMPNHIHGIIVINNLQYVGNKNFCSLQTNQLLWQSKLSKSLSSIIRGYKIGVTEYCHNNGLNSFKWQKSFYDHIIRNEYSLYYIRQYIRDNSRNWEDDRNNIFSHLSVKDL